MLETWRHWKLEDFEEKKVKIHSTCINLLPEPMIVKVFITDTKNDILYGLILSNCICHLKKGDLVQFKRDQIDEVILEN